MDIASILLGLALFILVGLFVFKPFITDAAPQKQLSAKQELIIRKEMLIDALRALEFDHDTGKMPDAMYAFQREALVKETAAVLKQIDSPDEQVDAASVDSAIEAAIARAKKGKTAVSGKKTCSKCNKRIDSSDKFCTRCGHRQ